MRNHKRCHILAAVGVAGALACVAGGNRLGFDTQRVTQQALEEFQQGNLVDARDHARAVACRPGFSGNKAWIIVAQAQQGLGQFKQAIESYRSFLETCQSASQRQYVLGQISLCEQSLAPLPATQAPSETLSRKDLNDLSKVESLISAETSDHFVIRTRNSKLAKLLTVQAEAALARIGREIMGGQEYPSIVEIYVWSDHKDYLAHATDAPEWSGGNFSLSFKDGLATRRIDLTQLNKAGRFDTNMLDRVLPHEMCHLVVREDFGEAFCPLFLHEGLAMLAEYGIDNQRILLAGTALAGKRKIALDDLVLCDQEDIGDAPLFYAESFSLLRYLQTRLNSAQFRSVLDDIKDGCTLNDALCRSLYMPPDDALLDELAKAWEETATEQAQDLRALQGQE